MTGVKGNMNCFFKYIEESTLLFGEKKKKTNLEIEGLEGNCLEPEEVTVLKRDFPSQKNLSPCLTQRPWEAKVLLQTQSFSILTLITHLHMQSAVPFLKGIKA